MVYNENNKKPAILIVDDTPSNLQILAQLLKDDYRVKIAKDGKRAIELAQSIPDLILLDIIMPDMDGFEVCQHLKSHSTTKNIPIIFVTGKTDEGDEQLGLELGAVDYIPKPIRPAIVKARVHNHIKTQQQARQLEYLAMHDSLTGLYNRHFLSNVATDKIAQCYRHKIQMSLIMLDIDFFKKINDQYGHPIGDQVLIEIAKIIKSFTRTGDTAARIGGEEFILLMDHCDLASATEKAESLRASIEQHQFDCEVLKGQSITSSFGVTELLSDNEDYETFFKRADVALYEAKNNGRNQVVEK